MDSGMFGKKDDRRGLFSYFKLLVTLKVPEKRCLKLVEG